MGSGGGGSEVVMMMIMMLSIRMMNCLDTGGGDGEGRRSSVGVKYVAKR